MDKIKQLRERKDALQRAGAAIRGNIRELCDEGSFVELSAFSFSGKPFYGEEPEGEGVVTGFFTVGGYPFYIVAQNFASDFGGLTRANCEKIAKTLEAAEKNGVPVVWLLHCQGVKIGEGVDALEGTARLLLGAARLRGVVPRYAVVGGEVYGAAAEIAALADAVFFLKEGALALTSPLVLSAKAGKNLKKEEVGGYGALKNALLPAIEVRDLQEVSAYLKQFTELIGIPSIDAELNESMPALNGAAAPALLTSLIEDGVELGAASAPEVKTVLGRIGGIAAAAVVFDNVRLNALNVKKIAAFAEFACRFDLPLVLFVDCVGAETTLAANGSPVLKEIAAYLDILDSIDAKISVVTGRAIGLGYTLFAAKSLGFDYTCALATAQISLFESEAGAGVVYANERGKDKEELIARYAEEYQDPVHAAKGGFIDDVIEPQFLKQHLIASLQMLAR